VVACVRLTSNGKVRRKTQSYGTTTADLVRLTEGLTTHACTHVALESTGVDGQPVGHVLEGHVTRVLANTMHVRNIPGRKSDVKDAPAPEDLEEANIKLTSVLSNLIGASGRAILAALLAGEHDPDRRAALMRGRVKAPRADRIAALHGRGTPHHRFILALHLDQIDGPEAAVRKLEPRVDERLVPFQADVNRVITMPGVNLIVASVLVAEIGVDMTRFPTAGHLVSWAGLCPRRHESAGRESLDPHPRAQFLRPKARRGPKKAMVAVAASLLTAAYPILKHGVEYRDLGADHFERRDKAKLAKRPMQRLRDLGLAVDVRPAA
jgi:transposase